MADITFVSHFFCIFVYTKRHFRQYLLYIILKHCMSLTCRSKQIDFSTRRFTLFVKGMRSAINKEEGGKIFLVYSYYAYLSIVEQVKCLQN